MKKHVCELRSLKLEECAERALLRQHIELLKGHLSRNDLSSSQKRKLKAQIRALERELKPLCMPSLCECLIGLGMGLVAAIIVGRAHVIITLAVLTIGFSPYIWSNFVALIRRQMLNRLV